MPTHARLLESLIEDYLAAGFGDPAADRFTSASASGEVHVLAILLEVVQAGVIIFLRALQADTTSLLSGAADHARDTVRLVTKDVPLLFGPLVVAHWLACSLAVPKIAPANFATYSQA